MKYATFPEVVTLRVESDLFLKCVRTELSEKELSHLKELRGYVSGKEGPWVLDAQLMNFIGGILSHDIVDGEARARLVRILALAAGARTDFHHLLHLDRKEKYLLNYASSFPDLNVEEQKSLALLFANCFNSPQGADWILYSSPWETNKEEEEEDNDPKRVVVRKSNLGIVSDLAGLALVSYTPSLQDYASALIFNIAHKDVKGISLSSTQSHQNGYKDEKLEYNSSISDSSLKDDPSSVVTSQSFKFCASTMSMAVFKYLHRNKGLVEKVVERCLKSLIRFALVIPHEIKESSILMPLDLPQISRLSPAIEKLCQELKPSIL